MERQFGFFLGKPHNMDNASKYDITLVGTMMIYQQILGHPIFRQTYFEPFLSMAVYGANTLFSQA